MSDADGSMTGMTDAEEPYRFRSGQRVPFAPEDYRALGIPDGTRLTANVLNDALDQMRANNPDGKLPPEIQAKVDAAQAARLT